MLGIVVLCLSRHSHVPSAKMSFAATTQQFEALEQQLAPANAMPFARKLLKRARTTLTTNMVYIPKNPFVIVEISATTGPRSVQLVPTKASLDLVRTLDSLPWKLYRKPSQQAIT